MPKPRLPSPNVRLACLFCATPLSGRGRLRRCGRCDAEFSLTRTPEGCVVGVELVNCGTPECCQRKRPSHG